MKLNAEIIRVAPHFLLIDQFLGLAGSLGPSKVTFRPLIQEITQNWVGGCWMSTHQVWIFELFILAGLSGSMNMIRITASSLAFEVLRWARLLVGSGMVVDTHINCDE